jgi:hypothetical protein
MTLPEHKGYGQDVIERKCLIHFDKGYFAGTVKDFKSGKHQIIFDDGDDRWFDLVEQDGLNALWWKEAQHDEVLGSRCLVQFDKGYFAGTIKAIKQSKHQLAFDDGDIQWFSLSKLEKDDHLWWKGAMATAVPLLLTPAKHASPRKGKKRAPPTSSPKKDLSHQPSHGRRPRGLRRKVT